MPVQKPNNDQLMSSTFAQTIRDNRVDYNENASKTMARFTLLFVGFATMLVLMLFCL